MFDKPNIILIVWDTVRYDHLSVNGYTLKTTPFLDSIRGQFIHFENAISQSHWTLPSFASMFTGLYPCEHRAIRTNPHLSKKIPNIIEILQKEGYQTSAFSQNPYVDPSSGLDRGFDTFLGWKLLCDRPARERNTWLRLLSKAFRTIGIVSEDWGSIWGSPEMVDQANSWLKNERQTRKPFFMMFNFMDAHVPCRPPLEYRQQFEIPAIKTKEQWHLWKRIALANRATDSQKQFWVGLYDAAILHLDHQLSRLFDFWKKLGILDDTVIILSSDHGDNYGEHFLYSHTPCLYDTILRIPLLIRLPGADLGNFSYKYQVELLDIFPTLIDIANIKTGYMGNGISLIETVSNPVSNRKAFAERYPIQENEIARITEINPSINTQWHSQYQRCVRTLEYKYILSSETEDELYDLKSDPLEEQNLINGNPQIRENLQNSLSEWVEKTGFQNMSIPQTSGNAYNDEVLIRRLEDLGYLG